MWHCPAGGGKAVPGWATSPPKRGPKQSAQEPGKLQQSGERPENGRNQAMWSAPVPRARSASRPRFQGDTLKSSVMELPN